MTAPLEPIPVLVRRSKCPHCSRTTTRPSRTREHMARCWKNPDARGCKTCKHFVSPWESEGEEYCDRYVDLAGRPSCPDCDGMGTTGDIFSREGLSTCTTCNGDAQAVKPGPIVHCDLWEASA